MNESFAARAWPGGEAVGLAIYQATRRDVFDRPLTIVAWPATPTTDAPVS